MNAPLFTHNGSRIFTWILWTVRAQNMKNIFHC